MIAGFGTIIRNAGIADNEEWIAAKTAKIYETEISALIISCKKLLIYVYK